METKGSSLRLLMYLVAVLLFGYLITNARRLVRYRSGYHSPHRFRR